MVSGGYGGEMTFFRPVGEEGVAFFAGAGLKVGRRWVGPARGEGGVGDIQLRADGGDVRGVGGAAGAEAMVDGRGLDRAGPGGGG